MDQFPLLMLPTPGLPAERGKLSGRAPKVVGPGPERQVERLGPAWDELSQSFEQRRNELRSDAAGLEPEEVVVLECLGPVKDFLKAAQRVPGLESLGEWDAEGVHPDDDFYQVKPGGKGKPSKEDHTSAIPRRLFLVSPTSAR